MALTGSMIANIPAVVTATAIRQASSKSLGVTMVSLIVVVVGMGVVLVDEVSVVEVVAVDVVVVIVVEAMITIPVVVKFATGVVVLRA